LKPAKRGLLQVLQVTFGSARFLEFQQVDHDHWRIGRPASVATCSGVMSKVVPMRTSFPALAWARLPEEICSNPAGRPRRLPKDPFDAFYRDLKEGKVLGAAAAVAARCLRYATVATAKGHLFDSAPMRSLDVKPELEQIIGGHLDSSLTPAAVIAIAEAIAMSKDKPLAAWCAAYLISIAVSQNFTSSIQTPSVYRLKHLQAFPAAADACKIFYGDKARLSTKAGPERRQYDPSSVSGLSLWLKNKAHPFTVIVDRAGGDQFNRCIENNTLKIALIQLNQSLAELCITWLSDESAQEPRFFGVQPKNTRQQIDVACARLKQAVAAGAGIALLPELTMTEEAAKEIGDKLATPETIIPASADYRTLCVAVTGSFHHVDDQKRRNTTLIQFPRTAKPALEPRRHSKSGVFRYESPRLGLEAFAYDETRAAAAEAAMEDAQSKGTKLPSEDFREDVEPSHEIRVYIGEKFSVVVVICADLLNTTFRDVVSMVSPSLVLVCNMTPTLDPFETVAHELILRCRATFVSVNNPAQHPSGAVPGAMVGMPLRDRNDRVKYEDFGPGEIMLFDVQKHTLERWTEPRAKRE
jgi:hypothetical protein